MLHEVLTSVSGLHFPPAGAYVRLVVLPRAAPPSRFANPAEHLKIEQSNRISGLIE